MLSPAQVSLVSQLAHHLYNYLPGSSAWGTYTFESATLAVGVGEFWPGGSKHPAITSLLERTLDERQHLFVRLIETVVTAGLKNRQAKGPPLTRDDVQFVIKKLRELGSPYSGLSNDAFLDSLPTNARNHTDVPPTQAENPTPTHPAAERESQLSRLKADFLDLQSMADRQAAGRRFEHLLSSLFSLWDLEPAAAFRVVGEQIDGAFALDGSYYLLEAKWLTPPVDEAELLVFRGKIEGKSTFTRGLFVSVNGYTAHAVAAITKGKQPNFVMMDGAHLFRVLDGTIEFDQLLRMLVRRLAERGEPYVTVSTL